jgi:hypothetical protein
MIENSSKFVFNSKRLNMGSTYVQKKIIYIYYNNDKSNMCIYTNKDHPRWVFLDGSFIFTVERVQNIDGSLIEPCIWHILKETLADLK